MAAFVPAIPLQRPGLDVLGELGNLKERIFNRTPDEIVQEVLDKPEDVQSPKDLALQYGYSEEDFQTEVVSIVDGINTLIDAHPEKAEEFSMWLLAEVTAKELIQVQKLIGDHDLVASELDPYTNALLLANNVEKRGGGKKQFLRRMEEYPAEAKQLEESVWAVSQLVESLKDSPKADETWSHFETALKGSPFITNKGDGFLHDGTFVLGPCTVTVEGGKISRVAPTTLELREIRNRSSKELNVRANEVDISSPISSSFQSNESSGGRNFRPNPKLRKIIITLVIGAALLTACASSANASESTVVPNTTSSEVAPGGIDTTVTVPATNTATQEATATNTKEPTATATSKPTETAFPYEGKYPLMGAQLYEAVMNTRNSHPENRAVKYAENGTSIFVSDETPEVKTVMNELLNALKNGEVPNLTNLSEGIVLLIPDSTLSGIITINQDQIRALEEQDVVLFFGFTGPVSNLPTPLQTSPYADATYPLHDANFVNGLIMGGSKQSLLSNVANTGFTFNFLSETQTIGSVNVILPKVCGIWIIPLKHDKIENVRTRNGLTPNGHFSTYSLPYEQTAIVRSVPGKEFKK